MKKIISIFLFLLFIPAVFASCNNSHHLENNICQPNTPQFSRDFNFIFSNPLFIILLILFIAGLLWFYHSEIQEIFK